MLIIGHRGAKGLAPENTVSSFKKAQDFGVGMIEVDLRKDGNRIVVSHDRLSDYSKTTTLQEVLDSVTTALNIELKETGIESQVLTAIKSFSSDVLVSSKKPWVLKKIRALDENIRLGLIIGSANFWLLPLIPWLDKKLKLYSVHPKYSLTSKVVVSFLKRLGKPVFVWTVNTEKQLERVSKLKVDGVFTDYPNLIKQ